uniref:RNA ligase n=1 Tax=Megaviridae environmental sample TaxID=1737588 RepID=A0A5J6VKZ7_9VIRU|nr:MAG: hypothetical protein [Megaviridae environmental sample]
MYQEYLKYIKYKIKYLQLKNNVQKGGFEKGDVIKSNDNYHITKIINKLYDKYWELSGNRVQDDMTSWKKIDKTTPVPPGALPEPDDIGNLNKDHYIQDKYTGEILKIIDKEDDIYTLANYRQINKSDIKEHWLYKREDMKLRLQKLFEPTLIVKDPAGDIARCNKIREHCTNKSHDIKVSENKVKPEIDRFFDNCFDLYIMINFNEKDFVNKILIQNIRNKVLNNKKPYENSIHMTLFHAKINNIFLDKVNSGRFKKLINEIITRFKSTFKKLTIFDSDKSISYFGPLNIATNVGNFVKEIDLETKVRHRLACFREKIMKLLDYLNRLDKYNHNNTPPESLDYKDDLNDSWIYFYQKIHNGTDYGEIKAGSPRKKILCGKKIDTQAKCDNIPDCIFDGAKKECYHRQYFYAIYKHSCGYIDKGGVNHYFFKPHITLFNSMDFSINNKKDYTRLLEYSSLDQSSRKNILDNLRIVNFMKKLYKLSDFNFVPYKLNTNKDEISVTIRTTQTRDKNKSVGDKEIIKIRFPSP